MNENADVDGFELPDLEQSYVLWRDQERFNMRRCEMTSDNISILFNTVLNIRLPRPTLQLLWDILQINGGNIYLVDDRNYPIFPEDNGKFTRRLRDRATYQVKGGQQQAHLPLNLPSSTATRPGQSLFLPTFSAANKKKNEFKRAVHFCTFNNDKPLHVQTAHVTLLTDDCTVTTVARKVKENLNLEKNVTIIDSKAYEINMTADTSVPEFWKVATRKIMACYSDEYSELQIKRKKVTGKKRKSGSGDVIDLTSDMAEDISCIKDDVKLLLANKPIVGLTVTEVEKRILREGLVCHVCKGNMKEPKFQSCCGSIVGCTFCIEEWYKTAESCPKCRDNDGVFKAFPLLGMTDFLEVFYKVFDIDN